LSLEKADESVRKMLQWAIERMSSAGFRLTSRVSLAVDPRLNIMGYARASGGTQQIVIAGWALDSEMLGGLLLHELAHIYFTERNLPSHNHRLIQESFSEVGKDEGLNSRELEVLTEAFSHLQNIIVDDLVFAAMNGKELGLARKFFAGWITELPSGDLVTDIGSLTRNAFAIASLKRRGLFQWGSDMGTRNDRFLASLGGEEVRSRFRKLEVTLEQAKAESGEAEFRAQLVSYLDQVVSLMRETPQLGDLR
jgi:hypothetical protein